MTQTTSRKLPLKPQLRLSLLLVLPLLLIVNGIIWSARAQLADELRSHWIMRAESRLDDALITIEGIRKDLHGDLFLLAGSPILQQVLDEPTPANLQRLAIEWEVFAAVKRRYDQIRWLDSQGMERLRVNLTAQGAVREADERLQDKSQRYYFKEAITLRKGQVYASPIDLNVEHDEVEFPYKPMLRLAVPVSDSRGERRGLLLVNVLASYLLDDLARHAEDTEGHLLLLDAAGYYLRGFSREREWGFMFPSHDESGYRFDQAYPAVWRQLVRQGSGRMRTSEGEFLFRALRYGSEGFGQRYFLVTVLLNDDLAARQLDQRPIWVTLALAVSLPLILLSLLLSRYLLCCRQAA